ncbi:MAG: hypothetical protein IPK20_18465 [Betaproteobacteria bacterium]|nr:hypothetical protein [Betaproteobacteria bacterium]
MALAALGRPRFRDEFRRWITVGTKGQYRVDAADLEARAGPPRRRGGPLEQHHFDLAASLQCALEDTVRILPRGCGKPAGAAIWPWPAAWRSTAS